MHEVINCILNCPPVAVSAYAAADNVLAFVCSSALPNSCLWLSCSPHHHQLLLQWIFIPVFVVGCPYWGHEAVSSCFLPTPSLSPLFKTLKGSPALKQTLQDLPRSFVTVFFIVSSAL